VPDVQEIETAIREGNRPASAPIGAHEIRETIAADDPVTHGRS